MMVHHFPTRLKALSCIWFVMAEKMQLQRLRHLIIILFKDRKKAVFGLRMKCVRLEPNFLVYHEFPTFLSLFSE